jgi:hypothetical protein
MISRFHWGLGFLSSVVAFRLERPFSGRRDILCHSKLEKSSSYSDDWLLGFHNQAQNEKQLVTDSLAVWNAELQQEQSDILEWQESFQRNGLADFTPPMSAGLNCLMVGGDINTDRQQPQPQPSPPISLGSTKLPWEEQPEADITSLRVIRSYDNGSVVQDGTKPVGMTQINAGSATFDTYLVSSPSRGAMNNDPSESQKIRVNGGKDAAVYDCIVDQGLMRAVLDHEEIVRELLLEAAVALREHGIYVLVTKTLSAETKALLEQHSIEAGFEWNFELDGISDDASQVSVARRFNTGKMPKIGKLSRFQP